jgi:inactivated superfamily I helicase
MRGTYQDRFSDDVGTTGTFSASISELRQSGGHRFNMQAEERVATRALMVHPRLRIVPVVLPKLQEFDAVLIVLNNVLLEPPDNEFPFLYYGNICRDLP